MWGGWRRARDGAAPWPEKWKERGLFPASTGPGLSPLVHHSLSLPFEAARARTRISLPAPVTLNLNLRTRVALSPPSLPTLPLSLSLSLSFKRGENRCDAVFVVILCTRGSWLLSPPDPKRYRELKILSLTFLRERSLDTMGSFICLVDNRSEFNFVDVGRRARIDIAPVIAFR